jgi:hypothetical protein
VAFNTQVKTALMAVFPAVGPVDESQDAFCPETVQAILPAGRTPFVTPVIVAV